MRVEAHRQRRSGWQVHRGVFIDGPRGRFGKSVTVFFGRWCVTVEYRVRRLPADWGREWEATR